MKEEVRDECTFVFVYRALETDYLTSKDRAASTIDLKTPVSLINISVGIRPYIREVTVCVILSICSNKLTFESSVLNHYV